MFAVQPILALWGVNKDTTFARFLRTWRSRCEQEQHEQQQRGDNNENTTRSQSNVPEIILLNAVWAFIANVKTAASERKAITHETLGEALDVVGRENGLQLSGVADIHQGADLHKGDLNKGTPQEENSQCQSGRDIDRGHPRA